MRLWRLCKQRHAVSAFDGEGAYRFGGRYNSRGTRLVYLGESPASAVLEVLVHLDPSEFVMAHVFIPVDVPETVPIETVDPARLPADWASTPAPAALTDIGDDWVASGRGVLLRVPAAPVPHTWNYLLNPLHPDFTKLSIGSAQVYQFDARLLKAP